MKFIVLGLSLLAVACKPATYPIALADPADPFVPVAKVRPASTLGAYESRRPVLPSNWREQNERVMPEPKQ